MEPTRAWRLRHSISVSAQAPELVSATTGGVSAVSLHETVSAADTTPAMKGQCRNALESRAGERLVEVVDHIIRVLETDVEP